MLRRLAFVLATLVAVLVLFTAADAHAQNLTIDNVTQAETNAGTTTFTFTVSLDAPAPPGGVTFDIATAPDAAVAGSDYVHQSLTRPSRRRKTAISSTSPSTAASASRAMTPFS